MSGATKIEWTDATWNPVRGCTKISLVPEALDWPLRQKKPLTIFVNSMSDLFHEGVPDEFIRSVWSVMGLAAHHRFIVLTKRSKRMRDVVSHNDFASLVAYGAAKTASAMGGDWRERGLAVHWEKPLANVCLGVSAENQKYIDERLPDLLACPAAYRMISAEPLLRAIELGKGDGCEEWWQSNGIDWVIVGGESGPGARPMHPDWARSLRDQCVAAGVPFFFKQWGEWAPTDNDDPLHKGKVWIQVAGDGETGPLNSRCGPVVKSKDGSVKNAICMSRIGKKNAGRILDGRTWDETCWENVETSKRRNVENRSE